jgi:hypothetical protein
MKNGEKSRETTIKPDLKFNITSSLLTLFGISLFLVAIKNAKSMGPDADLIVGAGDLALFLGFCSAIFAKIRNEPRRILTLVLIIVYGLAFVFLLFGAFMLTVVDI